MIFRKIIGGLILFTCVYGPKNINKISQFNDNNIVKRNSKQNAKENNVVFGYEDILKTYYNLATYDCLYPTKTYEQFYDSFYSADSNRNIIESTLELAEENDNLEKVYNVIFKNENISTISSGSSSSDEDYVLKDSSDYQYTPQSSFARTPYYSIYNYSPIKIGDIVWETETIFFNAGHNALITNIQHKSYYGNYIETIEAVGGGVQRGFLDDIRMTAFKCQIIRVKGNDEEKTNKAIFFAKQQVNKKYSLDIFRLNTAINSSEWYCSELVYACWKYAGIDIGVKKDKNDKDVYLSLGCLPNDINNSYNTSLLVVNPFEYLYLYNTVKSENVWSFFFFNSSSEIISNIKYTAKMYDYKLLVKNNWIIDGKTNDMFEFKEKPGKYQPYTKSEIGVKVNGDFFSIGIMYNTNHSTKNIIYTNITENGPLSVYEKEN